jgi:hypothetical protein
VGAGVAQCVQHKEWQGKRGSAGFHVVLLCSHPVCDLCCVPYAHVPALRLAEAPRSHMLTVLWLLPAHVAHALCAQGVSAQPSWPAWPTPPAPPQCCHWQWPGGWQRQPSTC